VFDKIARAIEIIQAWQRTLNPACASENRTFTLFFRRMESKVQEQGNHEQMVGVWNNLG